MIPFATADHLFKLAAEFKVEWRWVEDPLGASYARALRLLDREAREVRDDPAWRELLRQAKRFRFLIAATPLSRANPRLGLVELAASIRSLVGPASRSAPTLSDPLRVLVDASESVLGSENPAKPVINELSESIDPPAVMLLKRKSDADAVSRVVDGFQAMTETQLRRSTPLASLVVIGPTRWFPSLFMAPRASRLAIVVPRWVGDRTEEPTLFASALGRMHWVATPRPGRGATLEELPNAAADASDEQLVDPLDVLPTVRSFELLGFRSPSDRTGPWEEMVPASLFRLAGGLGVLLANSEDSRVWVLDPDGPSSDRVRMQSSDELSEGEYIIVRTGGGDLADIAETANQILGPIRSSTLRTEQVRWKQLIRDAVAKTSMGNVVSRLRVLGAGRASPQNVRNWMSMTSIRTGDRGDFDAIMALVSLESAADQIWDQMGQLVSAHRSAGQQIRRMLMDEIEHADLDLLVSSGRVDVKMQSARGGVLSAFLVEERLKDMDEVARSQLSHPFVVADWD